MSRPTNANPKAASRPGMALFGRMKGSAANPRTLARLIGKERRSLIARQSASALSGRTHRASLRQTHFMRWPPFMMQPPAPSAVAEPIG